MQKGCSIVVHSVINSIDPPVSAEMSHIATSLKRTSTHRSEHGTRMSPTRLQMIQNEKCLEQFLRWLPRLLAFPYSSLYSSGIHHIFSLGVSGFTRKKKRGRMREREIKVENPFPTYVIDNILNLTYLANSLHPALYYIILLAVT